MYTSLVHLLALPRELRDKIWEYAIANEEQADFEVDPNVKPGRFFYSNALPPVAFVQCFLSDEGFLVWVRTRRFEFEFDDFVPPWFMWCLDRIAEGKA